LILTLADTARFRTDDPQELVLASFACPVCLHGDDVTWELQADGYDPSVQCTCCRCQEHWRVYVTQYQALRLGLMAVHSR
jgi:DNA-directed RNA polymerase subunit M/transcription elongation factor TFIIS